MLYGIADGFYVRFDFILTDVHHALIFSPDSNGYTTAVKL